MGGQARCFAEKRAEEVPFLEVGDGWTSGVPAESNQGIPAPEKLVIGNESGEGKGKWEREGCHKYARGA